MRIVLLTAEPAGHRKSALLRQGEVLGEIMPGPHRRAISRDEQTTPFERKWGEHRDRWRARRGYDRRPSALSGKGYSASNSKPAFMASETACVLLEAPNLWRALSR